MKLELKNLAPYLPYDLKCDIFFAQQSMGTCVWRIRILDCFYLDKLKNNLEFIRPILRPLSDFNKVIEVNGEKFVPIEWFEIGDVENNSVDYGKGNVKIIGLLKDISKYNFITETEEMETQTIEYKKEIVIPPNIEEGTIYKFIGFGNCFEDIDEKIQQGDLYVFILRGVDNEYM
mgnify:CR=1 FL=1